MRVMGKSNTPQTHFLNNPWNKYLPTSSAQHHLTSVHFHHQCGSVNLSLWFIFPLILWEKVWIPEFKVFLSQHPPTLLTYPFTCITLSITRVKTLLLHSVPKRKSKLPNSMYSLEGSAAWWLRTWPLPFNFPNLKLTLLILVCWD